MDPTTERSRWRRPSRWIPAFIITLLIVTFIAFRIASNSGVKREVKTISERGLPVTALELDAWYKRAPASENAALAFVDAFSYYNSSPFDRKSDHDFSPKTLGLPLDPKLAEGAAEYVEKNAETLKRMHAAAELTASRYSIDLSRGFATLLPHLAHIKQAARLLKWEAMHHSAQGRREQAVRSLMTGFTLASSLSQEPILISELVRIASLSLLLQAMERVVTEQTLTDAELTALGGALRKAEEDGKKAMWRAMVGERAIGMSSFDLSYGEFLQLSAGPATGSDGMVLETFKATLFTLRRGLGLRDSDLAFYIQSMGALEKAMSLDHPDFLRAAEAAHEAIQKGLENNRFRYLVSGMLLPSLAKAATKEAIQTGRLRCARMALAIERYRHVHHGRLPSLDDLVPDFLDELPRDPVDGQPLRYELNDTRGYRILSAAATAALQEGRTSTNVAEVAFTVRR